MSVLENLEMGAFQRRNRSELRGDLDRVYSLFPRLAERKQQRAGTLSGGEQQMVAIGRALMAHPRLLLLDEPSMGLAPIFVERVFETIVEINQQGTTILLVEQNAMMALDVAARGYVLETGRVALSDDAKRLRENEDVQKTYLGIASSRSRSARFAAMMLSIGWFRSPAVSWPTRAKLASAADVAEADGTARGFSKGSASCAPATGCRRTAAEGLPR